MIYYFVNLSTGEIENTDYVSDIINKLYEGTAIFITAKQVKQLNLDRNYLTDLKTHISLYSERVPLYDIVSDSVYLVHKDNVYPRILNDNYRFVTGELYDDAKRSNNKSEKIKKMADFIGCYDLSVLERTYMKIFYESFVKNEYITSCRRPSFSSGMGHVAPYYTMRELYYLAYDWDMIKHSNLSSDEVTKLCHMISKYDIPSETLLINQLYIYDTESIGLVKHYSLYGSYFMNTYLREYECLFDKIIDREYFIRNLELENQIKIFVNLIRNAPAFKYNHTVYRFVHNDTYLINLAIGDIYVDPSFMSTTRNPFYYHENYAFGNVLLKINLPANIKGIGICIESYSNFPAEEEIVLPPLSRLRLDAVNDIANTTSYNKILDTDVIRKYEFTMLGHEYLDKEREIVIYMDGAFVPKINNLDMAVLFNAFINKEKNNMSIAERITDFCVKNVKNLNNQFSSKIGNINYLFTVNSYDSTSVYKPFFYYEVSDGLMITSTNPKYGNINIIIELGPEIHINYYFKFSVTDSSRSVNLDNKNWLEWLSFLAFIIGVRFVIIHSTYYINYSDNDTVEDKQTKTRYTYSHDIYQYLKYKKKMFSEFNIVVNFDYIQLDYLFNVKTEDILKVHDRDELYSIAKSENIYNMGDMYLYIAEKRPKLLSVIEKKMDLIYLSKNNPFKNISYRFDAWAYLYSKNYLQYIPSEQYQSTRGSFVKAMDNNKIKQFTNRLREYIK